MRKYSEVMKESMVKRIVSPGGLSALKLSKEVGIAHQTLSRWVKEYGKSEEMEKKAKGVQSWSAEEKLEALLEAGYLEGEELGAYLRRKGLHSTDLERWRQETLEGLKSVGRGRPRKDPEIFELQKREKVLQRELRRKEKALAEASALLVLKKKAELIWGVSEDEESD